MTYDNILKIDRELFLVLNGDGGNFTDIIMVAFTSKLMMAVACLLSLFLLYKNQSKEQSKNQSKKQILLTIVFVGLLVLVADQTCNFFKINFSRLRPMHEPLISGAIYLVDGMRGGMSGTVSAHAANSFGVLFFFSLLIRDWRYTLAAMFVAAVICYSRIYLGYHYPLDIFYGTFLGFIVGYLFYKLYLIVSLKYINTKSLF